jgi:putative tryptophan/tyrosine transport system substrate-binding protein
MDRRTFMVALLALYGCGQKEVPKKSAEASKSAPEALEAPFSVGAEKSATPVIGFLSSASPAQWTRNVVAFRQGLNEAGYDEGKNVAIEFRWAEGHYDQLPKLAADLVRRQVAVVVASGGNASALAAKAATSTIPIVCTGMVDPVGMGLVASLGRPGGNVTGVSLFAVELDAKRMELLHELVPKATVIALLVNPDNPYTESRVRQAQEDARSFGQELHVLRARTEQDIDAAFATLVQLRAGALVVGTDPFFNVRRDQIVGLAARHAVATVFNLREFVTAGGLMSYGPYLFEAYRQAGIYTGKILNGAKPADLAVLQPTKVELVINLKTAKALGITIPQPLLLRADEVIQ